MLCLLILKWPCNTTIYNSRRFIPSALQVRDLQYANKLQTCSQTWDMEGERFPCVMGAEEEAHSGDSKPTRELLGNPACARIPELLGEIGKGFWHIVLWTTLSKEEGQRLPRSLGALAGQKLFFFYKFYISMLNLLFFSLMFFFFVFFKEMLCF